MKSFFNATLAALLATLVVAGPMNLLQIRSCDEQACIQACGTSQTSPTLLLDIQNCFNSPPSQCAGCNPPHMAKRDENNGFINSTATAFQKTGEGIGDFFSDGITTLGVGANFLGNLTGIHL